MKKPIIGTVNKPVEKYEMDFWNRMDICDEFRYLVLQSGGISIFLLSHGITFYFNDNDISEPKYDIPVIGICVGFNNIVRALGTDVIEDKTNSHNFYDMDYRHKITSYSEEGLVESFEAEDKNFVIGVKRNPELMLYEILLLCLKVLLMHVRRISYVLE